MTFAHWIESNLRRFFAGVGRGNRTRVFIQHRFADLDENLFTLKINVNSRFSGKAKTHFAAGAVKNPSECERTALRECDALTSPTF
jgi:hypothetical protein